MIAIPPSSQGVLQVPTTHQSIARRCNTCAHGGSRTGAGAQGHPDAASATADAAAAAPCRRLRHALPQKQELGEHLQLLLPLRQLLLVLLLCQLLLLLQALLLLHAVLLLLLLLLLLLRRRHRLPSGGRKPLPRLQLLLVRRLLLLLVHAAACSARGGVRCMWRTPHAAAATTPMGSRAGRPATRAAPRGLRRSHRRLWRQQRQLQPTLLRITRHQPLPSLLLLPRLLLLRRRRLLRRRLAVLDACYLILQSAD